MRKERARLAALVLLVFTRVLVFSSDAAAAVGGPCGPILLALNEQNVDGSEASKLGFEYYSPADPMVPPQLRKNLKIEAFGCDRRFYYEGKWRLLDSIYKKDGEKLRPIVKKVPKAVGELNAYQETRRSVQFTAYTGAVGFVLLLLGTVFVDFFEGEAHGTARVIGVWGGAGLILGSGVYSYSVLTANESRISRAVDFYNQANPEKRIHLKVSTGGIF